MALEARNKARDMTYAFRKALSRRYSCATKTPRKEARAQKEEQGPPARVLFYINNTMI